MDTSRVNLEKNIRDKKFDRAVKSPLRARKEGQGQISPRRTFAQESKVYQAPSLDVESPPESKT